ncbi:MAG: DUF3857 domain-containing protein [Steroidobacter sp.]
MKLLVTAVAGISLLAGADVYAADRAPDWMQALKSVPVPEHRDKDDAVCMYSERVLTVKPNGKMTTFVREAYKILRPDSPHAVVRIPFDDQTRIDDLHAWSIPTQGKDYAVKDRDAAIIAGGDGSVLVSDDKVKVLTIPGADPGALIGYEYEQEERPYFQEDLWMPQDTIAVREANYTLQLPAKWSYKSIWRNGTAIEPVSIGENRWKWVVHDLKAIHSEDDMPPLNALALQLIIRLVPVEGQGRVVDSWRDLGNWYTALTDGRRTATPAIKQQVSQLLSSQTTLSGKMQALAGFAQGDVRYVAISLGIGGLQPHFAGDVFSNRYGDCKDKVTLLSAMLKETGIDSYYVIVNDEHDVVAADTPPSTSLFDHAIIAIQLPATFKDPKLLSIINHPVLGNLLIFDPTNPFIPFGELPGYLQGNFAMLVRPEGTELVKLPIQASSTNGILRTARFTLNDKGTLAGDVTERYLGEVSSDNRASLQKISADTEKTKFLERKLANALASFKVSDFKINNQMDIYQPLEYKYSFEAEKYAKFTGDMLIVRPRILGGKSSALLEGEEKRENPVQFVSPQKDTDEFIVTLPAGYVIDDLPAPVDIEYPFGSYHSKTTVAGNTLRYTRAFEIRQFTVPLDKLDDLKMFYQQIYRDERANAVLIKK